MPKEYRTIREVAGPLMMISDVDDVKYDELGEIELPNGETGYGRLPRPVVAHEAVYAFRQNDFRPGDILEIYEQKFFQIHGLRDLPVKVTAFSATSPAFICTIHIFGSRFMRFLSFLLYFCTLK